MGVVVNEEQSDYICIALPVSIINYQIENRKKIHRKSKLLFQQMKPDRLNTILK